MIDVKSTGSFSNTLAFFDRIRNGDIYSGLDAAGRRGINALAAATPQESGITADSWKYRIVKLRKGRRIEWYNTHEKDGVPIAILIQYGHGTGDGTFVEPVDYVNPAMEAIFQQIAEDVWRQVKR